MKIINVENFEINNGVLITSDLGEVYAQLPETGDSQHSFIDGRDDDKLLEDIVSTVNKSYTDEQLSVLTELGTLDYKIEELENTGLYVAINNADINNYVFLRESNYNNYYNVFLLESIKYNQEAQYKYSSLLDELYQRMVG